MVGAVAVARSDVMSCENLARLECQYSSVVPHKIGVCSVVCEILESIKWFRQLIFVIFFIHIIPSMYLPSCLSTCHLLCTSEGIFFRVPIYVTHFQRSLKISLF